jgi:hypothetical protein
MQETSKQQCSHFKNQHKEVVPPKYINRIIIGSISALVGARNTQATDTLLDEQ